MASGFTPTKTSTHIVYTPRTKQTLCVLCGVIISLSTYRRKLFHGSTKTEKCILIEKSLDIDISSDLHTDIVCKKCMYNLTRANEIITQHKNLYYETINKLKKSHGRETTKRLSSEDTGKKFKRKSLFSATTDGNESVTQPTQDQDHEQERLIVYVHGHDILQSRYEILPESKDILLSLLNGNQEQFVEEILKTSVKKRLLDKILVNIQEELKGLCSKENPSVLRKSDKTSLASLTWEKIDREWKEKAPTFHQFLEFCSFNPSQTRNKRKKGEALLPGLVTAGCKLFSIYNQEMNAVQHINSVILLKGGAKQSAFARLNSTFDCLSYLSTLKMSDDFGKDWNSEILTWARKVDDDNKREKQIQQQIDEVRETIDFLGNDPTSAVDSVLEVVQLEKTLSEFQKHMHPGYYFVGDNVDMRTSVRQMTRTNQSKDQHMYQMCAYQNRVSGNSLQNSKPKGDVKTVPFESFIPSTTDIDDVMEEFSFIVAQEWTRFIPFLEPFRSTLPKYIKHPYLQETKQKSKRVNLGVLRKNEQYNDEMTDICEFLHRCVPGHDDSDNWNQQPQKILSGGDYLTFERHKQAQSSKRNGRTPSQRLEGLIPKMEEFHNQAELLQVIWKLLYSTSSAKDIGTMYSARHAINSKNVSQDPHSDFYASSEFFEKFTTAYIILGGMNHFGMSSLASDPTVNTYVDEIGNATDMQKFVLSEAKRFVNAHARPTIPILPKFGPQSNTLVCRYCGKEYVRPKALRKHEHQIHGLEDPLFAEPTIEPALHENDEVDYILNYTRLCLTLGLIQKDHNDAIKMGDGNRIMRVNKLLYMYYKACGCPKYAFGILETLTQATVLLSERKAHQLVWNRTVNHRGEPDSNHPNDLDLEHCNKVFKDEAHSYRGIFTDKTLSRVSRSAQILHGVAKHFDRISNTSLSSGKHKDTDTTDDIVMLVQHICPVKVFDSVPGRAYTAFPSVTDNPLKSLNMEHFRDWISESITSFGKKHFYN